MRKIIRNLPWQVFVTGVGLLTLSHIFQTYDMAVVSLIGLVGPFVIFAYNCRLDREIKRDKRDNLMKE